jgi:hypothetical protein
MLGWDSKCEKSLAENKVMDVRIKMEVMKMCGLKLL